MAGNRKDFLKGRNYRKPLKEINNDDDDNEEETPTAFSSVVMKKKLPPPPNNKLLHFATPGWFTQQVEKTLFQFDSSKQIQVHNDSRATATLETETEIPKSHIHKRTNENPNGKKDSKGKEKSNSKDDDRLYKGICAYKDHKTGIHGPLRAPTNIRTSSRFDYQPDVCKDYKETGYCGYGDSCKFLHDRGDYKSGWQLEKEWDQSEKERKRKLAVRDEDDHDHDHDDVVRDDGLPFACYICRGPFVNPVITKCKHYFCEKCALKHHGKKKSCYVCNRPTYGIFDTAHEIRKKMMKKGKK